MKVLALLDVSQVDVLEEYQLLIVLSGNLIISCPIISLNDLVVRASSNHLPSRRPGSHGSHVGTEES